MYRSFLIHDLHMRNDEDYIPQPEDEEFNSPPDYCDYEDHFQALAEWAVKECGYTNVVFSHVWEENWNCGDWWEHDCRELPHRIEGMMDEDNNIMYQVHGLAKTASWTIGEDNREQRENKQIAICITYCSGDDSILVETHAIGQCPYFKYDHQLIKKRKARIQVTFYVSTSVKDTDGEADVNRIIDRAINEHFDEDNLQEKIHEELDYYTSDYDPTVYVKRDKVKIVDVPKTRKI